MYSLQSVKEIVCWSLSICCISICHVSCKCKMVTWQKTSALNISNRQMSLKDQKCRGNSPVWCIDGVFPDMCIEKKGTSFHESWTCGWSPFCGHSFSRLHKLGWSTFLFFVLRSYCILGTEVSMAAQVYCWHC